MEYRLRHGGEHLLYAHQPPVGYEQFPWAAKLKTLLDEGIERRRQNVDEANAQLAFACNEDEDVHLQFRALKKMHRFYTNSVSLLYPEDQEVYKNRLRQLTMMHADALFDEARRGNIKSLRKLHTLTKKGLRGDTSSVYTHFTGEKYIIPGDWNEVVAKLFMAPKLKLFRSTLEVVEYEQYQVLAARALRLRDLTEAKMMLALSYYWPRKTNRADELADLIAELHAEMELFQGDGVATMP